MIDIQGIKNLIGRPLTEREHRHITWINGWDSESRESFARLIKDAYWNGAKESNETIKASSHCMSDEDALQFATALAHRYLETEKERTATKNISTEIPSEAFVLRQVRVFAELDLFNEVINKLPPDIRKMFYEAYDKLKKQ